MNVLDWFKGKMAQANDRRMARRSKARLMPAEFEDDEDLAVEERQRRADERARFDTKTGGRWEILFAAGTSRQARRARAATNRRVLRAKADVDRSIRDLKRAIDNPDEKDDRIPYSRKLAKKIRGYR